MRVSAFGILLEFFDPLCEIPLLLAQERPTVILNEVKNLAEGFDCPTRFFVGVTPPQNDPFMRQTTCARRKSKKSRRLPKANLTDLRTAQV